MAIGDFVQVTEIDQTDAVGVVIHALEEYGLLASRSLDDPNRLVVTNLIINGAISILSVNVNLTMLIEK